MRPKPDIIAEVHLFNTADGGRQGPTPHTHFGCVAEIAGEFWDCRLLLEEVGRLAPGVTAEVPIKFLLSNVVLPMLRVGSQFRLWEGRYIGSAKVLSV